MVPHSQKRLESIVENVETSPPGVFTVEELLLWFAHEGVRRR